MKESLKITGTIRLTLRDSRGRIKARRVMKNMVVNNGRAHIIDRLQGTSSAVADYIAIGAGASGPTAADATLGSELARAQGALTQPDAYTDRCVYTFPAGTGTGTVTECGRLNASSNGTLMGRQVFTGVGKGSGDSLQVQYDFTYAAS
jgi:hypothetical protein